jgi:hypothetical protein
MYLHRETVFPEIVRNECEKNTNAAVVALSPVVSWCRGTSVRPSGSSAVNTREKAESNQHKPKILQARRRARLLATRTAPSVGMPMHTEARPVRSVHSTRNGTERNDVTYKIQDAAVACVQRRADQIIRTQSVCQTTTPNCATSQRATSSRPLRHAKCIAVLWGMFAVIEQLPASTTSQRATSR